MRGRTIATVLLTAGCVANHQWVDVARVGRDAPVQHVVRVSQFALTTDFEIDKSDPLVLDLLGLRDVVYETLGLPPGDEIIRVIIFENQQRYDEFIRLSFPELPSRRAFFVKQTDGQLAVFACQGDRLREDLRHEVTHSLLHSTLPSTPIWLDEGLAEYFEIGPGLNGIHAGHVQRLRTEAEAPLTPDLKTLEGLVDLWQMTAVRYRESWLWVHFCLHHSPQTRQALLDHIAAIRAGKPDRLAERLEKLLGDPNPKLLAHLNAIELPADGAVNESESTYHRGSTIPLLAPLDSALKLFQETADKPATP